MNFGVATKLVIFIPIYNLHIFFCSHNSRYNLLFKDQEEPSQRRTGRFAVSMGNIENKETAKDGSLPRQLRGILKQSNTDNSATIHETSSPYSTLAAAADKWRNTVQNITSIFSSEYTLSPGGSKKRFLDFDMDPDEQKDWEAEEMEKSVDFSQIKIDPAPFQLPEKSSLLKVHSLFSMLGKLFWEFAIYHQQHSRSRSSINQPSEKLRSLCINYKLWCCLLYNESSHTKNVPFPIFLQ